MTCGLQYRRGEGRECPMRLSRSSFAFHLQSFAVAYLQEEVWMASFLAAAPRANDCMQGAVALWPDIAAICL